MVRIMLFEFYSKNSNKKGTNYHIEPHYDCPVCDHKYSINIKTGLGAGIATKSPGTEIKCIRCKYIHNEYWLSAALMFFVGVFVYGLAVSIHYVLFGDMNFYMFIFLLVGTIPFLLIEAQLRYYMVDSERYQRIVNNRILNQFGPSH